jgi:mono/diheme cytochrome c family protein
VYLRSCVGCHKPDLRGDSAEEIPGLVGDGFKDDWDNETVGSLFERISKRMPADKPGTLTATEYADLLAYLLRANGFPYGGEVLRPDIDALRGVVLTWAPR